VQAAPHTSILPILCRSGLAMPGDLPPMEPLTGGVSSDIWRVDLPDRSVCVKRALGRLKVKADWRAPVDRNSFEAAWMRVASEAAPDAVPRLIHQDQFGQALVMDFLDPHGHSLWKEELRQGRADPEFARQVGWRLVAIHGATAIRPEIAAAFPTDTIFHAIRLEPYLLATAAAHPDLERQLTRLVRRTATTKLALVHGDVSPKNILVGPSGPIFLDAECAWYGDPAFDLAFCLNHLLLKCLWTPEAAAGFIACFEALAEAYLAGVTWEPRGRLEARAAALLPGLMLARIDGKSPVEYLTEQPLKTLVRGVARRFLEAPASRLAELVLAWREEVGA
jgi:aminoglycoside phosphotransferase (APT) family kinase protein